MVASSVSAMPTLIRVSSGVFVAGMDTNEREWFHGTHPEDNVAPILRPAIHLDVTMDPWPIDPVDAVFNSNMVHISPWFVTENLMKGVGQKLKSGGVMVMYGPYIRKEFPTAPSNVAFDQSLRARNKLWGIRDLDDVIASAKVNGLLFDNLVEMPANNYCVIYKKAKSD